MNKQLITDSAATTTFQSKRAFWRSGFVVSGLAAILALATINLSCSDSRADSHAMLPIGYVDAPQNGAVVQGTLATGGWTLSEDGIDDIEIYIDRAFVTATTPNTPRPDVLE